MATGAMLIVPRASSERAALAIELEPQLALGNERARRLDPLSQLALVAVEGARRQAGLEPDFAAENPAADHATVCTAEHAIARTAEHAPARTTEGVVVGSALGATITSVRYARRLVGAGPAATNPIDFPDSIDGAPAAHIALCLGLGGPSLTFTDGASSAISALVQAARQIAWGRATRMVVLVGDKFDPLFAEAIARDPSFGANGTGNSPIPAECVFALVLERRGLRPPSEKSLLAAADAGIELVGFLDEVARSNLLPPQSELDGSTTDECTWSERGVWQLDAARQLRLFDRHREGLASVEDPSGALELAGAWLRVAGPTEIAGGALEPAVLAPIADRVHCGRPTYPRLGFVRSRTL